MKTIFNTYVVVDQEQADRLKQVCIDNGLKIWETDEAFETDINYQYFSFVGGDFWVKSFAKKNNTQVTETEWMELLKQYKS
jgi:hypothetical protein